MAYPTVAEAVVNYLNAVGIRVRLRTMERATFLSAWRDKKLRGVLMAAVGASGSAATRAEAFMYSKGTYAYGGYPDLDELCVAVPPGAQGAAPVQPRLSLTLAAIARARTLVLLTGGGVKRAVLDRVLPGGCEFSLLPIAALFAARPDTILLHGPK